MLHFKQDPRSCRCNVRDYEEELLERCPELDDDSAMDDGIDM
jgi:hypothetical protein